MEREILYSCDASIIKTAKDAAVEFARSHWGQPRKVVNWQFAHSSFQVKNGTRVYFVELDPGKRFERTAAWQITVQRLTDAA